MSIRNTCHVHLVRQHALVLPGILGAGRPIDVQVAGVACRVSQRLRVLTVKSERTDLSLRESLSGRRSRTGSLGRSPAGTDSSDHL